MWTNRVMLWRLVLCMVFAVSTIAVARGDDDLPLESQCRPYVEKALKGLESEDGESESSEKSHISNVSSEDNPDVNSTEINENSLETEISAEETDNAEESAVLKDEDDKSSDRSEEEATVDNESGEKSAQENENSNEENEKSDESYTDKDVSGEDVGESEDNEDDKNKDEPITTEAEDENLGDSDDESSQETKTAESTELAEDKDSNQESQSNEDTETEAKESEEAIEKDIDETTSDSKESEDDESTGKEQESSTEESENSDDQNSIDKSDEDDEGTPEEELLKIFEIPDNLRSREHINTILRLDENATDSELLIEKSADIVLRDLKKLYENSIKPLEVLYKYRDLSNRHFGDPEIFSKPLVLFMGPWSGGKSSTINYLTGLEFTEWALRTGAEPSPAYFNILMHGEEPEVLDGTQLAADWTFSGLQKFGQGLEERLRGLKYPSKLLEKVNIVEIPGILEVRKQVSRIFPFNDACQWFIDRADIIFLIYDPSKLDVGPETEAILDQLKGRESQTRIILNKADTVRPEELMRVQSALIWNISPLMSSAQPPIMYTVSLWSMPYDPAAPVRLLQAQEKELLRDLRRAIDRRIENKIASARRFAVRVRNHAKMVDCYLTTYYNHKTIFGNRKLIADAIIENPQNYHIYEGLSTLTNISRYDLPDPESYRDFFRLNPVYEFQPLSSTCTYFRGCPITRLDVAIAYDLPEIVGKYKKMVETATPQGMPKS